MTRTAVSGRSRGTPVVRVTSAQQVPPAGVVIFQPCSTTGSAEQPIRGHKTHAVTTTGRDALGAPRPTEQTLEYGM